MARSTTRRRTRKDVRLREGIHDGDGVIKLRGLFTDVSQLPMRVQVWELDPGVSEGKTHARG